jgi:hypothetical protein
VKCPSCSAEIADKAIVCYRCGQPTAQPVPVRQPPGQSRARLIVLVVILAAAVVLLLYTYLRSPFV